MDRRFGGLDRLYGVTGAASIRAAHVVVVGVGGVGSWTVEALARSGVGRLTLIDLDNVAESNINRQIHALDDTVGMAKVEAMRLRIAHINSDCVVTCIEDFVEPGNWPGILNGVDVDAVIDACDQVKAKTAMAAWAIKSCSSPSGPLAANAWRTKWTLMICPTPATIHSWPSCVTTCAVNTALRARAKK
jgi:tRNA A37 threonylcarbamoyladenosine dehydratase